MKHAIYDGNDKRLKFKGALVRKDLENKENYLAQFDSLHLPESIGWTSLPAKDFVNLTGKW